jgi:hypothetical protein
MTCIQYLKLKDVDIIENATITGSSFPELSVLDLSVCIDCHLAISLPNHHLKKVNIEIEYLQGENCVLSVNTMNNGKPQRSLIRAGDTHDYKGQPSCGDTPTSLTTERIIMEFTCASVKEFSNSIGKLVEVEEEVDGYNSYAEYYNDGYDPGYDDEYY